MWIRVLSVTACIDKQTKNQLYFIPDGAFTREFLRETVDFCGFCGNISKICKDNAEAKQTDIL